MRITLLQNNLKKALSTVGNITNKNVNLPILNNVLIEASDGQIKIVATNLEIGITYIMRGKVNIGGSFTLDSKMLLNYVSLLPNDKVDLELEGNAVRINCASYKTKIFGQSSEEFPLIPSIEGARRVRVDVGDLKMALSQVIFAVSTNEIKQELGGVYFSIPKSNELVIAATDSFRLVERRISMHTENFSDNDEFSMIIPARTIQELIRIISNIGSEDGVEGVKELEMDIAENQVKFTIGPVELISRLIVGRFPDYRQIIPVNIGLKAGVNRNDLIRAAKTSALFAKNVVNDVVVNFNGDKVVVSSSSQIGESVAEVKAEINGKGCELVVNCRYLLEGLNSLQTDMVKFEIVDGNTPCILKPDKADNHIYIIMPIKQ